MTLDTRNISHDDIRIDQDTGIVTIDGTDYFAHDLTYEHTQTRDARVLLIHTPTGGVYRLSAEKTFWFWFGRSGKCMDILMTNWLQSASHKTAEKIQRANERRKYLEDIQAGLIPRIDAPYDVLLKKNEYAVMTDTYVQFCQERTKTTYHSSGVSVRIAKGVTLRGGRGSPHREEYIATLDTGRLTLTSKRLIFLGEQKSTTIPLSRIAAVEPYTDGIAISKENAVKKTIFANIDGEVYATLLKQLTQDD